MKDETRLWLNYADENLKSADFEPDEKICNKCIKIAQTVKNDISRYLK